MAVKGRANRAEPAPIRYAAALMGFYMYSERAIRWIIALMVLCCDPLAIVFGRGVSTALTTSLVLPPPLHGRPVALGVRSGTADRRKVNGNAVPRRGRDRGF